jgi:hypothetical protein
MEYLLTADGHDLASALRLLADWGARHAGNAEQAGYEPMRHQTCGTPLEARWYCPTCTVVVTAGEADELRSI